VPHMSDVQQIIEVSCPKCGHRAEVWATECHFTDPFSKCEHGQHPPSCPRLRPELNKAQSSLRNASPSGLNVEDWALMVRVLDLIKANAPADAGPGEVVGVIEEALRARYAKPT
jgi:hypothetical protein